MTTDPPTMVVTTVHRFRRAKAQAAPSANPAMIIGKDPAGSPAPRLSPLGKCNDVDNGRSGRRRDWPNALRHWTTAWAMTGDPALAV